MSDIGPQPAKRARRNNRNGAGSEENESNLAPSPSRYMLRSRANGRQIENIELPTPKRKRRPRLGKLMDLSGDCLMAIFKEMDPKTLAHVADTCERLRNLAKYHFRLKYSDFDFELFGNAGRISTDRLSDAEIFFRHFGDQIVSLKIDCSTFIPYRHISIDLLRLINRYCYQLKTLMLYEFNLRNNSLDALAPFNTIENLTFVVCSFIDCDLGPMENVKRLVLDGNICNLWSDILWKNFPKLEDVEFRSDAYLNNESIVQFINMNPSLKRLSVTDCYSTTSAVFKVVAKLGNLQEFEYLYGGQYTDQDFQTDLAHLSSLKNLKVLKLDCFDVISPHRIINDLINNGIAIEHLMLIKGLGDDELFEIIANMNILKVLQLIDIVHLHEKHVLDFVKNLKQLEKLSIKAQTILTRHGLTTIIREANHLTHLDIDLPDFILTLPIYLEILDVIQKREGINKLHLTIYGIQEQLSVPDEVVKGKNEKWLSVKWLSSFEVTPIY